jgi:hypothetical protein
MDDELEAKLVKKTTSILRMARKVIEQMHAEREEGFQEEPSLSDLVLVAQIIGQTATIGHLEGIGAPRPPQEYVDGPPPVALGALVTGFGVPDIAVLWTPDGWYIHSHPDFNLEPLSCQDEEELASSLRQVAGVCASRRMPPPPPDELPQRPE